MKEGDGEVARDVVRVAEVVASEDKVVEVGVDEVEDTPNVVVVGAKAGLAGPGPHRTVIENASN